jgi:hypothetical protein
MTGVTKYWAIRAPEAAAAWVRNASAGDRVYLDKMLAAVASPQSFVDTRSPAEAFRAGIKVNDNGYSIAKGFDENRTFRDWLKTDADAAIQEIKSSPVLSMSMHYWLMIYEHLESTSPERAQNFLKEVPGRRLLDIATALALKYVDSDITRARSFADSLPPSGAAHLTTQLAKKIVAKDPGAAPTWIQYIQQADPTFLPISIYGAWLRHDPKKAAEDLFKNPAYTSQVAANPDELIAAGFVDFAAWVNVAPVEAANFATRLSGDDRYRSLNKIATAWFERDKPAALNWVRDLPEGEGKEFALREFTYELSRASWNDGEALLATLKTPRALAAGIEGFAVAGFDVNPDEVLKWVRKIGDEKSKSEVLKHAWSRWSRNNSRAASDWLESVVLSEKERAAIDGGE